MFYHFRMFTDYFDIWNSLEKEDHYVSGQGAMWSKICFYFYNDKPKDLSGFRGESPPGFYRKRISARTTKSTKPPARFKGWKNKR